MAHIKSADEIYDIIMDALENVTEPVTCADLMERPAIREAALLRFGKDVQIATNKLSDLLGFMWRRGVLERYAANDNRTKARFAYTLKNIKVPTAKTIPYVNPTESLGTHALSITERPGEVVLDFKQFTVVIRPKG